MVVKLMQIFFKAVANSHNAIQCDDCNIWVHAKCNRINTQRYKFLQKSSQRGTALNALRKYIRF